jgi:beta-phosphoglucomutase
MTKLNLRIKAVIFDMDGVITNSMPDHFRAWKTVLAAEGVHVTHFDVYQREGQRGINSVEELFKEKGKAYHSRMGHKMLKSKERLFKKIVKRRYIPGSRSFLKFLHKKGCRLALVTGTSRHELHKILPDYLFNLFEVVVTGTDVKNGKPHPEPFLRAIKQLKIKPSEGVVIENAPFGIRSAKAAGLTCLAIETSLPKVYLRQADYIFSQIGEIRRDINFLTNGHLKK